MGVMKRWLRLYLLNVLQRLFPEALYVHTMAVT